MHKREVCHVEEVFDHARRAGVEVIGTAQDIAKAGIVPFVLRGNGVGRVAHAHPQPTVLLMRCIRPHARLVWRRLFGVRGDQDAAPVGIVRPTVIGTFQRASAHLAQRQPRATMDAQVTPRQHAPIVSPQHKVFVQHARAQYAAVGQVGAAPDDVPVIEQDWVCDHALPLE
jgi:hypothetical protein